MYDFARGPLVWIAFIIFFGGLIYRLFETYRKVEKDKVVLPYMSFKYGIRSILHWMVPFGTVNMRMRPAFTILSYAFHLCLIITPLFTLGHAASIKQSWGINWPALPDGLSLLMTIIVISGSLIFALRRIADPAVRLVTSFRDVLILIIVAAPFITGLLARFQVFDYQVVIILHMWTGALWLTIIPFTRIVHMLFFPFTRAYMGSEFGYVRNARDW